MSLAGLLDREAVRDLVHAYAEAADRGRSRELAELFTADGVLEIVGDSFDRGRYASRVEIAARLERTRELARRAASQPLLRHHIATVRVVLEEEQAQAARVDAYFLAVTDAGADHWGRYRDRVVRTAAGWRFAHRRVVHEGHAEGSWLKSTKRMVESSP